MKKPKLKPEETPDTTRNRILDAGLLTFAESGFKGATTKEIARRAKVNEVTVFRQFGSKKTLFTTVMTERSPLNQAQKAVSFNVKTPIEELMFRNIKTVLGILRESKHLYMVILGDVWRLPKLKGFTPFLPIAKGLDFLSAFFQMLMDAGKIRKMDAKILARAWMGTVQFHFLTGDMLGIERLTQAEEDRTIRGFVDVFLNGMRTDA
jgi:AcrR family transcriptional regulator